MPTQQREENKRTPQEHHRERHGGQRHRRLGRRAARRVDDLAPHASLEGREPRAPPLLVESLRAVHGQHAQRRRADAVAVLAVARVVEEHHARERAAQALGDAPQVRPLVARVDVHRRRREVRDLREQRLGPLGLGRARRHGDLRVRARGQQLQHRRRAGQHAHVRAERRRPVIRGAPRRAQRVDLGQPYRGVQVQDDDEAVARREALDGGGQRGHYLLSEFARCERCVQARRTDGS